MTHQEAVDTLAPERYLLDEMTGPERDAFEDHYFTCHACAEDVHAGALMRDGARIGLAGPEGLARPHPFVPRQPARARRTPAWSVALPWAAAASLAVLAGYQSFVAIPALRRESAPQVLSPVTLRPAARGTEPVVRLDGGSVLLAADVPGASGPLVYRLLDSPGREMAAGSVASPAPGAPLLLLLRSSSLSAGARYTLIVEGADGTPVGEYRFTVEAAPPTG